MQVEQIKRGCAVLHSECQSASRQLEKTIFSVQRLLAKQHNCLLEGHLDAASI